MDAYGHLAPGEEADAVARMWDLMVLADALQATGTDDSPVEPGTGSQRQAQRAERCDWLRRGAVRIPGVRWESNAASPFGLPTWTTGCNRGREWGRQDSNLEPTDYESRSDPHGPADDLR